MRALASLNLSPGGAPYNSPAVEPRKGRNPGKRPQKQMRTPEGWHKAWLKNAALFQNAANMIKHAPTTARSVASLPASRLAALACYAVARRSLGLRLLRPHWRHCLSAYAASLRSVAPGSISFFLTYRSLRRYATPPPALYLSPLPGLKFRLADARKIPHHHPFKFRFVEQGALNRSALISILRYEFIGLGKNLTTSTELGPGLLQ